MMQFDILKPDVVDSLGDYDWFRSAITLSYRDVAKAYGCVPLMSGVRLLQTYDIFWEDVENGRIRHLPEGTVTLNQFKVSAYLTFWLRRINPVSEIRVIQSLGERSSWSKGSDRLGRNTENFLLFGNEIAALNIGLKISQYLSLIQRDSSGVTSINPDVVSVLDDDTIMEFAKILKYKNISAHSLNMVFQMVSHQGVKLSRG